MTSEGICKKDKFSQPEKAPPYIWSKLFGKRTESDDELDDVDEITEDDETL